jgi:hypothetical protein
MALKKNTSGSDNNEGQNHYWRLEKKKEEYLALLFSLENS